MGNLVPISRTKDISSISRWRRYAPLKGIMFDSCFVILPGWLEICMWISDRLQFVVTRGQIQPLERVGSWDCVADCRRQHSVSFIQAFAVKSDPLDICLHASISVNIKAENDSIHLTLVIRKVSSGGFWRDDWGDHTNVLPIKCWKTNR